MIHALVADTGSIRVFEASDRAGARGRDGGGRAHELALFAGGKVRVGNSAIAIGGATQQLRRTT